MDISNPFLKENILRKKVRGFPQTYLENITVKIYMLEKT